MESSIRGNISIDYNASDKLSMSRNLNTKQENVSEQKQGMELQVGRLGGSTFRILQVA